MADVGAGVRADVVGGGRDHRAELLDEQVVGVVGDLGSLRGEVLGEEAVLLAERAVQVDGAVGAAQRGDARLELLGVGGADGEADRGVQQRRAAVGGEVVLQRARGAGPARGLRGGAVVAVLFLAVDVVGVDDLAPHQRGRAVVGDPARVEDGVDREVELLQGGEQQLGLAAGERDRGGEGAEREQRLVAVAVLGRDLQVAFADGDRAVDQAQQVGLQRLVGELVAVEHDERLGAVVDVEVRFAEAAGERAAHEPLEVERGGGLAGDVLGQAGVDGALGGGELAQPRLADRGGVAEADGAADALEQLARRAGRRGAVAGEPDGEVDLGADDLAPAERARGGRRCGRPSLRGRRGGGRAARARAARSRRATRRG